jgi:regulator of replication initiation timing
VLVGLIINPFTAAAYVTAVSGLMSIASVFVYKVSSRQRLQRIIQEIMFGTQGIGTWQGQKGLIDRVSSLDEQLANLHEAIRDLASQVTNLAQRLTSVENMKAQLNDVIETIKELKPNGGNSIADNVNATREAVDSLQKQFGEHIVTAEKAQKQLYDHISECTQKGQDE